ncbi:peptidoglycan editing factor PgeF [Marinimicrobium agarilyticum]|uniref:peptidoglycan editing factor PgeF n=1 Tax=Marinimicrobium agarilyticum TaxID=306546 RepID=UPI00040AE79F|nr:peptidoglycan editing factor PgeF [Marinimicrobium agarilyticum]
MPKPELIYPDWPAPARVTVAITTRRGGTSGAPYDEWNLAHHVGDAETKVRENRALLKGELDLPLEPQWLEQIHGTSVVEAKDDGWVRTADGAFTDLPGLACAVLTADCLPVLLCNRAGTRVAALHAGWRGLAGGILAAGVARFHEPSAELMAYLGPALSQPRFEVGVEVLEAFFEAARNEAHAEAIAAAFLPGHRPLHFQADLYALARAELSALGVSQIYGGEFCTGSQEDLFYSYRRDGQTGRMASLIWINA